jgi:cold shock CspA family protein
MKPKKQAPTWIVGHINWYDPHTGKGSIIGDDGIWYRIHEFADIQQRKQRALKDKARVEFKLASDSVHPVVTTVRQNTPPMEPAKSQARSEKRPQRSRRI